MFALTLALLGQVQAHTSAGKSSLSIDPPLKDVSSDKKFFGPPFPADYPEDTRPVVQKHVLDKLKGPDQPYPKLQSKSTFDSDYVKDENSDKGAWAAQFEYDALRKKLAAEERDEKSAQDNADREAKDIDGAQKNADDASKAADDAQKEADAANAAKGDQVAADDDFGGAPSAEKLEKLKAAVAEAEANYEKEKKEFEQCKKQLEESEKLVKDLKAKQAEMEAQLAKDTQLWAESKAMKLNVRKTQQEATHKEWMSKHQAAQERLAKAEKAKAEMGDLLAKQKAEHDQALKNLAKEKAEMKQAKDDMEKATLKLQKLRGYKPVETPAKSSATSAAVLLPMLVAVVKLIL
jgi:hypothetical protein